MGLFKLNQQDITDCLGLISSANLSDQARRVAQLQVTLAQAAPAADREKDYAELLELWKVAAQERDTARALAVALEQSVAELKEQIAQLEHARAYAQHSAISHE